MKRAGETFEHRYREALSRISALSQKQASATLTANEKKELQSLQLSMSLSDNTSTRAELLPELEAEIKKLEELQAKANKLLKAKPKRE